MLRKESTTPGDPFSGPVIIKWKEGTPAPVRCYDHIAVWLNGQVYVAGGSEHSPYLINCYDPVNNSWSSPIDTPYNFFAMTTLNNQLVTVGGQDKSSKTTNQILMMDAGQMKNYSLKMIKARSHATAAGHQGMLIIIGGKDSKGKELSTTELFDSNIGQWYKCNDLPLKEYTRKLKSVIVDNVLYLFGAYNYNEFSAVLTAPLDTLSTHLLKWNFSKSTPRAHPVPINVNGTHLLVVGGYSVKKTYSYENIYYSDVYKLNKVMHSWEAIGHLPSPRQASAAVSTDDNRVIIIGGRNNREYTSNTVWIGSFEPQ